MYNTWYGRVRNGLLWGLLFAALGAALTWFLGFFGGALGGVGGFPFAVPHVGAFLATIANTIMVVAWVGVVTQTHDAAEALEEAEVEDYAAYFGNALLNGVLLAVLSLVLTLVVNFAGGSMAVVFGIALGTALSVGAVLSTVALMLMVAVGLIFWERTVSHLGIF